MAKVEFDVHLPNLIEETCNGHPHLGVLRMPWAITQALLAVMAQRAIELDDPQLNILMLRLALYEAEPCNERHGLIRQQEARLQIAAPPCPGAEGGADV